MKKMIFILSSVVFAWVFFLRTMVSRAEEPLQLRAQGSVAVGEVEGSQIPKEIEAIYTASGRPNVFVVSLNDPYPLLSQYSIDYGETWQELVDHSLSYGLAGVVPREGTGAPVRLISLIPVSYYGSSMYRSGDWGETWASGFLGSNNYSFAISPKNSQYTYWSFTWTDTCYMCDPPLHTELHQSTDGGVNWTPIYSSVGYEIIAQIAPSPVNEGDGFFKINYYFGGEWWYRFGSTNQLTFPVELIALDAVDANRIYGVTENFSSGQTSLDGGLTWVPWLSSPPPACVQLMAHPTQTNTLYLRCAAGLFRSTNGGDSWVQITFTQGDALAPHLGNPGQILWSHTGCLYASDTDGDSWNSVECFSIFSNSLYLPITVR